MSVTVRVQRVGEVRDGALPAYQSDAAAGMDICAALPDGSFTLEPDQRVAVPTGLRFEIPNGFEGQIRPRSGLALNHGITLVNAPGTIDSDFRGEVKIIMINHGDTDYIIQSGQRIAQMVIAPVVQCHIEEVDTLSDTKRGDGGFGSTGN